MKETIRCCIACILPCGSLDVIRIVHSNGYVEEISGSITAKEIMRAHPKHVLRKPSSPPPSDSVDRPRDDVISAAKIVVVPPDAELQRGKIYFLMPVSSSGDVGGGNTGKNVRAVSKRRDGSNGAGNRRHGRNGVSDGFNGEKNNDNYEKNMSLLISDRYLTEILSEKVATQRDRRRGRVGVWRPHLESISETENDAVSVNHLSVK
ncbi:PREDICTED: uncharacterized protein LOC104814258 [Tarenaya hassleriana]|uniref:uncharacterized protein LOC104814258 n=1 Tax=Tarenaya hassleriana TaxID=28532 RepID=UPI00053C49ED|nr:PREDICTED: uncharacterized protein LOC104814258 [Tarenaya hassleriana]